MAVRFLIVWLVWLVAFGWLYLIATQHVLDYHIDSTIAGFLDEPYDPFASPYTFRRLVLPRLISFIVIAAPSTAVGILAYHRLIHHGPRWGLRTLTVVVTLIACLLAIHATEPSADSRGRWQAVALAAWCAIVTVTCLYLAAKRVDTCTTR
jgi:hypothetical protein